MFGTKKKKGGKPRTHIKDPLAVIPLIPDHVEQKRDSRGMLHLKVAVPMEGWRARIAGWLGYDYSKKVVLDKVGTAYYELVDGQRTSRQIIDALSSSTDLSRDDLARHVLLFTRALMTRGLIALEVTKDNTISKPGTS